MKSRDAKVGIRVLFDGSKYNVGMNGQRGVIIAGGGEEYWRDVKFDNGYIANCWVAHLTPIDDKPLPLPG